VPARHFKDAEHSSRTFLLTKKDDNKKMFTPPLETYSKFSSHLCQSVYDVKQKALLELCEPVSMRFPIARYCKRWRCNFKGLSQDVGREKYAENHRASPFNKDLSNKEGFIQIHLAGQYL
jgi:hypothetical protein